MGLHKQARIEGEILYNNANLVNLPNNKMNELRGDSLGMIFQDPMSALNPLMIIGDQIEEVLYLHNKSMSKKEQAKKALYLLKKVGITNPKRTYHQFPHELSGGMRQRVIIAIAIANEPEILIADEPTTALDATIQSQILDLMVELKEEMEAGIILITHDLGVVAEMADRVAVMYAGQIVEITDVYTLFNEPLHPYTRSLLNSVPQEDSQKSKLHVIQGIVPSLQYLPRKGCRFSHRTPWIDESIHEESPVLHEVHAGHFVRCTCHRHFHFMDQDKEENEHGVS